MLGPALSMHRTMQWGQHQRGDGHTKAGADNEEEAPATESVSRRQKVKRGDRSLFWSSGWGLIFKKTNNLVR